MRDPFIEREWSSLGERLRASAVHIAAGHSQLARQFTAEAERFAMSAAPERYPEWLDRVREAARLVIRWRELSDEWQSSDATDGRCGIGNGGFMAISA